MNRPDNVDIELGFFEVVGRFNAIMTVRRVLVAFAFVGMTLFPLVIRLLAGFGLLGGCLAVLAVVAAVYVVLRAVAFPVVVAELRGNLALISAGAAASGGVAGLLLLNGLDRRFGSTTAFLALAVPALFAALDLRRAASTVAGDRARMLDQVREREEVGALRSGGGAVPLLACRNIDFAYGQLQVLFGVDFTVDEGEMVALLGTNGAGKSTLLRVIAGLAMPGHGTVRLRGADITYVDADRRLGLGVTQIAGGQATFGPLTVVENLRVYAHSLVGNRAAIDAGINATFDAFPRLAERRNVPAARLSGGEQQMLALGKALIVQPRLLLIDELSLGLAPKIVGELLEMVRRINDGGTAVVLVEQSVNLALSLVEHAYFMEKGEMRFDGRAAELLNRPDLLRSVFLEGAAKATPPAPGSARPGASTA